MNHPFVKQITDLYKKRNIPNPKPGDILRVHQIIKEGEKERVQVFEGVCLKRNHGTEIGATFTVRKIAVGGVGVERTFPLHSPLIVKVERLKSSETRRAKLNYLRNINSSKIRLKKEKNDYQMWEEPEAEKELEKIKEEQEKEAQEKAQEKAKKDENLEKQFEEAKKAHASSDLSEANEQETKQNDGQFGGEAGGKVSEKPAAPNSKK